MNKLEIEIPEGKEIDWQESAKQEKIVFKEKQLTYEDVCEKLFSPDIPTYAIDDRGVIISGNLIPPHQCDSNNATSQHQLECILAKNKLANVARYLNDDWKYSPRNSGWILGYNSEANSFIIIKVNHYTELSNIVFKTRELAEQAIEILGEDTIRLSLTPLY